ncbi:hypothetical protein LZ31DRAFT_317774 [Colletotrichum somersetense]|nr:hypothetical protein LZ31DRAFT_317774 [Colletotrichum somersetense]
MVRVWCATHRPRRTSRIPKATSLECAYTATMSSCRRLRRRSMTQAAQEESGHRNKHPPAHLESRKIHPMPSYFTHVNVPQSYKSRLRSQESNQGRAPGPSMIHPPSRFDHRSQNPGNRACGEQPTESSNCLVSLQSHTVVCWCRLTSPLPQTTRYRLRTAAAGASWCSHTVESMFHPPSLAFQAAIPMLDSLFLLNKTGR